MTRTINFPEGHSVTIDDSTCQIQKCACGGRVEVKYAPSKELGGFVSLQINHLTDDSE